MRSTSKTKRRAAVCRRCGQVVDGGQTWMRCTVLAAGGLWIPPTLTCEACRGIEDQERRADEAAKQARRPMLIAEGADLGLGVPARYRRVTFLNTQQTGDNEEAFAAVDCWAGGLPDIVTLWGPPGIGKTHLAIAGLHELYLEGEDPKALRFADVAALVAELRADVFRADGLRERIAHMHALVLDDLGLVVGTDWVREHICAIISRREAEGLLTIVTTNLSLGELSEVLGDRAASRLAGGVVVHMTGTDRRLRREGE